jgi:Flp pilus assembly protein protease CpaA
MEIIPVVLHIFLYGLVGAAAYGDIRSRTFPVWIGWACLVIALASVASAGQWLRFMTLLLLPLIYRIRINRRWADLLAACVFLLSVWHGDYWFALPGLAAYLLFCLGWLGAGDAEIALPVIGVFGSEILAVYLIGFWIFVPPLVLISRHGLRGGAKRLVQVARQFALPGSSPLDDPDAMRLPWIVSPFLALTLIFFGYPGRINP